MAAASTSAHRLSSRRRPAAGRATPVMRRPRSPPRRSRARRSRSWAVGSISTTSPARPPARPRSASTRQPASACTVTAATAASKGSSPAASMAPQTPLSTSPVPPVARATVRCRSTWRRPSGAATTVSAPLRTRVTPRSAANRAARPARSACTSAVVSPASRAISAGCGVSTSGAGQARQSNPAAAAMLSASASTTAGTARPRSSSSRAASVRPGASQPGTDDHGGVATGRWSRRRVATAVASSPAAPASPTGWAITSRQRPATTG